jgi:hypothetical protein
VCQEAFAEVLWAHRGTDVPRAWRTMPPEALERLHDHAVDLFKRQIGAHDAVVVVDRYIPDYPSYPPVVALLRSCRTPERDQELLRVLLYSLY